MTSSTVTKSPKSESETEKSESGVLLPTFKTSRDKDDFKTIMDPQDFALLFSSTAPKSLHTVASHIWEKWETLPQQFSLQNKIEIKPDCNTGLDI